MTTTAIWIDPVELTATSGALAEQAMRIQETVTGTRTTCTCEVPRSLIAWLDEELNAITVEALTVAVGYLQEALDCRQRAVELEAEQSLALQASGDAFAVDGSGWMAGVIGGASIVGGSTMTIGGPSAFGITSDPGPTTMTIGGPGSYETFLANNPLLAAAENLRNTNPGAANQLLGLQGSLFQSQSNMAATWLAPQGLSFVSPGLYADDFGRTGSLSQSYRDRRTGDLVF
ncbi:hypothetical protein [Nocardioides terrigena]|uniref:hypothetical protein n=1 Tax=Nocardioides terrigena TaxID=424797 RepID=UPI000D2FEFD9|nr:hypothetical protein [Nocardioides terrigena]